MENLLPKITPHEEVAKYLEGSPREYRFNASSGCLNIEGEQNVTKKGDHFVLIPVAVRIFKASLFERKREQWLEIAFLNNEGHVCGLLFHGFSVEEFQRAAAKVFYMDTDVTACTVTVKPQEKTSKATDENGKANKFYICSFDFKKSTAAASHKAAAADMRIYRADTVRDDQEHIIVNGWHLPPSAAELPEPTAEQVLPEPAPVAELPAPKKPRK